MKERKDAEKLMQEFVIAFDSMTSPDVSYEERKAAQNLVPQLRERIIQEMTADHFAGVNKMVELRPMGEAPRNETSILLYYKDETEAHPVVGWWPLAQRKGADVFSTTENFLLAPECFKGWLPIPQVELNHSAQVLEKVGQSNACEQHTGCIDCEFVDTDYPKCKDCFHLEGVPFCPCYFVRKKEVKP